LHHITNRLTDLSNTQMSLENWVDKYIPIRVIHMITETVGAVLPDKQKNHLLNMAEEVGKGFRKDILHDQGHSKLKQRALELITSLRQETQAHLETKKTLKAAKTSPIPTESQVEK